ncbi:MAG TPA: DNA-processing protein DprA [Candidatus Pacearchaeota archaeon]|nr:DNA-processing protein DprA [Candidatus Pacearchaeota archaeon]
MEEIKEITIEDKNYPELLRKIKNPPKKLYIRGKIKNKENCFAIVGTRNCSDYGKRAALDFSGKLLDAGITIVSGMAPGIDTFSHRAAIKRKKRTIAVLGTGLDEKSIFPKENILLSRKIIEYGGCLISEYPPNTKGTKFTFPQRNRIISGLSLGTLIVEAKEKSGSLITANYTIKQKRKLFAIPGQIYSLNSKGTNNLIKNGAILASDVNDILKELKIKNIEKNIKKEIKGDNKEENLILNILKEKPLHIDKIIEKTNLPPQKVAGILTILEYKDKIENLGGNVFSIIN